MAKGKRKIYGIAKNIFNKQNAGGGVPSAVLSSSRAVFDNSETQADRDVLFNYYRQQQGMGRPILNTMRRAARVFGGFDQFGRNTRQAIGGDVFQMAGGIANNFVGISNDVRQLARLKPVKQIANQIGEAFGMEEKAGAAALGSASKLLSKAAVWTMVAEAGAKAIYGATRMTEALNGIETSETLRQLRTQEAVGQLEGVRVDARDRRLMALRVEQERVRAQSEAIPGGGLIGDIRNRDTIKTLLRLETQKAMRESGFFGGDKEVLKTARSRVLRNKYGATFGAAAEALDDIKPSIELAKESAAMAAGMTAKAAEMRTLMYKRAGEGAFGEAKGLQAQIDNELGTKTTWREPQTYFVNQDNARAAARVFPSTQTMRRLRSYE